MSTHYELYYTDRKTLGIKVYPDTSVKVFAPIDTPLEVIALHVEAKSRWIKKQQAIFDTYLPKLPPRQYVGGETFLYLGRQYMLRIEETEEEVVRFYQGRLVVKTLNPSSEQVKELLQTWYHRRAKIVLSQLFSQQFILFNRFQIEKPTLVIKPMEKRWGSCTTGGKILLNVELIKAPVSCIVYVILHELCHLVHHNHSRAFYSLLESFMPDWRRWKQLLETMS